MKERVYKFLDKNYPVTGIEIEVNFDRYPDDLIFEVFGVKFSFNDWVVHKLKSTKYIMWYYGTDNYKRWYDQDFNLRKIQSTDGSWTTYEYKYGTNKRISSHDSDGYWETYSYGVKGRRIKEETGYNDDNNLLYYTMLV